MKKMILITMLVLVGVVLGGCVRTSTTVNHNLSKDADEFNLYRKITVTNARTDTVMLQAEGYMSLSNNSANELVVTIKTGDNTYYQDYIYLNNFVIQIFSFCIFCKDVICLLWTICNYSNCVMII